MLNAETELAVEIRILGILDVDRFQTIDRSGSITGNYRFDGDSLVLSACHEEVRGWPPGLLVKYLPIWRSMIEAGDAQLLGAFTESGQLAGLAIVRTRFRPGLAQLASLYVDNRHRRAGVAQALSRQADSLARQAGVSDIYVSAAPAEAAVRFYLREGYRPADAVSRDAELFALEPADIHMRKPLKQVPNGSHSTVGD